MVSPCHVVTGLLPPPRPFPPQFRSSVTCLHRCHIGLRLSEPRPHSIGQWPSQTPRKRRRNTSQAEKKEASGSTAAGPVATTSRTGLPAPAEDGTSVGHAKRRSRDVARQIQHGTTSQTPEKRQICHIRPVGWRMNRTVRWCNAVGMVVSTTDRTHVRSTRAALLMAS